MSLVTISVICFTLILRRENLSKAQRCGDSFTLVHYEYSSFAFSWWAWQNFWVKNIGYAVSRILVLCFSLLQRFLIFFSLFLKYSCAQNKTLFSAAWQIAPLFLDPAGHSWCAATSELPRAIGGNHRLIITTGWVHLCIKLCWALALATSSLQLA